MNPWPKVEAGSYTILIMLTVLRKIQVEADHKASIIQIGSLDQNQFTE